MGRRYSVIPRHEYNREGHGFSRAEAQHRTFVIPSEAGSFATRIILRSRGTCFFHPSYWTLSAITAGLSTSRIDSQASRFTAIEMTAYGELNVADEGSFFQSLRDSEFRVVAGTHA